MEMVRASVMSFQFSRILYYVCYFYIIYIIYNVKYSSNMGVKKWKKKTLISCKDSAFYQALIFLFDREKGVFNPTF